MQIMPNLKVYFLQFTYVALMKTSTNFVLFCDFLNQNYAVVIGL